MRAPVTNERVVLCHGAFDLLHLGHIRHLQEARNLGDRLIVSVTADQHVHKGVNRPHFTAAERVEAVKALDCVDDAFISLFPSAIESIKAIKPEYYVKGCDYEGNTDNPSLAAEIAAVTSYGGKYHVTKAQKFSSSRILNTARFPKEVTAYLESARARKFLDKIKEAVAKADQLRILFVGETIIDEYRYVSALGKPSKEFMLATVEERREEFIGGINAAMRHGEWRGATMFSVLPLEASIRKTRYVDADFTRKLFEVYSKRRVELRDEQRSEWRDVLRAQVKSADAVVVMDFGHGLMGNEERRIVESAKFLAVNAQTNSGNVGFNPVTLYNRADLVCVDEPEARLAWGQQFGPLTFGNPQARCRWIITKGRHGCSCFCPPAEIPAFTMQTTDTIGAGDAFLAAAAPLVAAGLEPETAAFVGNVAGAIKTTIIGHRRHVTRAELMQNVEALLA